MAIHEADPRNCPCCQARLMFYRQMIAGRGIDPLTVAEQVAEWLGGASRDRWTRGAAFDATVKAHDETFSLNFGDMAADAAALGIEGEALDDLRFQIAAAMVRAEPALSLAS